MSVCTDILPEHHSFNNTASNNLHSIYSALEDLNFEKIYISCAVKNTSLKPHTSCARLYMCMYVCLFISVCLTV